MPMPDFKTYDDNNIFAMILRGEIPNKTVYEDDFALAFHDINPQAPVHVLVIPKGKYISMADFTANADDAEIAGFMRAVGKTAEILDLPDPGYRLLANHGPHSHQEVPHLHVHIFGGKHVGPLLMRGWEGKIKMPNMD
jgi:histidine triad (HIT) family protein